MKFYKALIILLFAFNSLNAQWTLALDLQEPYNPSLNLSFGKVCFVSAQNGYYFKSFSGTHSQAYEIHGTSDGWQSQTLIFSQGGDYNEYYINDMVFIDETLGYKLSGYTTYFEVSKTTDGGHSWTTVENDFQTYGCSKICYPKEDLGYYLGTSFIGSKITVIKSDSGNCTIDTLPDNLVNPFGMFFTNDSTGYIFCQDTLQNFICLRTTNYADSWSPVISNSNNQYTDVYFPSAQVGYITAKNGVFYKTTNSGQNWDTVTTTYSNNLNSVHFLNNNLGYIAGDTGLVIKTTDGGINWQADTTNTTENINEVFFSDSTHGYFATYSKVYKSANAMNIPVVEYDKLFTPNPTRDIVTVYLSSSEIISNAEVSVYSLNGKLFLQKPILDHATTIDIRNFPKGIYILKIRNNNTLKEQKIVKE